MVPARGYPERGCSAILFFRRILLADLRRLVGPRGQREERRRRHIERRREGKLDRGAYGVGGAGGGGGALGIQIHR